MKPYFSATSSNRILQIIYDYQLANCIKVAADLNIAELLYESSMNIKELSAKTGTNPEALYRLLRILAAEGIFKESEHQFFEFTPSANALHGETTGSIKYYLQAILGEHAPAFANLLHSVKTGETAFDHYYKTNVWDYYSNHPDIADRFNKAMAGLTQYYAKTAIPVYPFNDFGTIVDIGGGNGALMFSILAANDKPEGIIFDAPSVISRTQQLIGEAGLAHRCTVAGGDFFESVPAGKDLYLLKYILHDWPDEDSIKILRNCAAAMKSGSKILLLEAVIPPGNDFHAGKYTDITMLACTGGRERSAADFEELLTKAGLRFNKVIRLQLDEVSLIEGEKV